MKRRSIWISGPVHRLAEYADAAREAGWEAIEAPLIQIVPVRFAWPKPDPDWIVLASASALPSLERHAVRLHALDAACVGHQAADGLIGRGAKLLLPPALDAMSLLAGLALIPLPGPRVLWPHGDRSTELAAGLIALGAEPLLRLAYRNQALEFSRPPTTDWVFVTSPSAVQALANVPSPAGGWHLIAIGNTTLESAAQLLKGRTAKQLSLTRPDPRALFELLTRQR